MRLWLPKEIFRGKKKSVEKKEVNPLSFWDGRLVLDIEERIRGEIRENNRDFDSSFHDDNDDF